MKKINLFLLVFVSLLCYQKQVFASPSDSGDKQICEEQEKGKWITQNNISTCTCPKQLEGYFWNKDSKKCEYEDTDAEEDTNTEGNTELPSSNEIDAKFDDDMQILHKAFLDKIEQLKQSNSTK